MKDNLIAIGVFIGIFVAFAGVMEFIERVLHINGLLVVWLGLLAWFWYNFWVYANKGHEGGRLILISAGAVLGTAIFALYHELWRLGYVDSRLNIFVSVFCWAIYYFTQKDYPPPPNQPPTP